MERSILETVNSFYEKFMFGEERVHHDKIGFFNLGYWKGVEDSVELAQINLIETLVKFFASKDGYILDVACGKGASSKFLTKYFDARNITGINISERQLGICRQVAPECNFKLMDATKLSFDESSFDNVLCIEAAHHFMTRRKFCEEAHRVLKTGGRLAMSDVLMDYDAVEGQFSIGVAAQNPQTAIAAHPRENYLPNLDAYTEMLSKIGFKYVRVEDVTEFYTEAYARYALRRAEADFGMKHDYSFLDQLTRSRRLCFASCLVYAIK